MIRPVKTRWPLIVLITLLFLTIPTWFYAQAGVRLRVLNPDTTQFPIISLSISIIDDSGTHISNLSAPNFVILEDGETIAIDTIEEVSVGTRQIFIINSSRGLRGRDAQGLTRFDYVRKSLIEWWARSDAATYGIDDLSLLSLDGQLVSHSPFIAELASAISAYEPSFEEEFATFDPLLEALQLSSEALPGDGVPTLVFFITPLITEIEEFPLANTITRAKDNNITIYPILVGPDEILQFPEVDTFRLLADATGGELLLFDTETGLNDFADRILSRRLLYTLSYTSKVNSTGSHNLQVRITSDGIDGISDPSSFNVNISAPEIILLQMPDRITRQSENPDLSLDAIPPTSTTIKFLVTFPDGYPREIAASQLIIDSQVVEIRNQPPFDSFDWDLSGYQETGSHEIKILVEDVLGLQGSATGMPITIEVITPEGSSTSFQPDLDMLLPIGGGVTAFLLISMLVITINRRRRAQTPATTGDTNRRTPPSRSFGLRRSSDQTMVEATLIPVDPNNPTISLIGMDLVLGRDASISAAHLDDLSVNAVHARMIRLASGDYLIRDQGSVAGTWVNYHQVPERGKILQHGDMIHLGRIEYQFQLRNPPLESRIHVESIQAPISETNEENRGVEETTT